MIGRRELPSEYQDWNRKWGAPYGYLSNKQAMPWMHQYENIARAMQDLSQLTGPDYGPFALQPVSQTRIFEYPWAFFSAKLKRGLRVLDIGGGIGGMQFVLDMEGCDVVNADPTARPGFAQLNQGYVQLSPELHQKVNAAFGTSVEMIAERLQEAKLAPTSFDRVFCISVLEHLDATEATEVLRAAAALLKPDGLALVTVDLFLDLKPFGVLETNIWGRNQNVWELVQAADLELAEGDPRELLGYPEFDRDHVVRSLPELLIADYPVMTQTAVLRKRPQ
jgi:2-polyprenyl-3-methyl-5-hydroxy-6-metoxy-1,4-benzoquinol methylase